MANTSDRDRNTGAAMAADYRALDQLADVRVRLGPASVNWRSISGPSDPNAPPLQAISNSRSKRLRMQVNQVDDRMHPARARMTRRGLPQWNELTRSEQRILIKLFGGGTLRANDPTETAKLRSDGLIDDDGLTPAGISFVKAAFMSNW